MSAFHALWYKLDRLIEDNPQLEEIALEQGDWEEFLKLKLRMTHYPEDGCKHIYRGRIIKKKVAHSESLLRFALQGFDLADFISAHRDWSRETFGPDQRTESIVNHIKKELDEILENPTDLTEWIDVMILAIDGAWRAGHDPKQIVLALVNKSLVNMHRKWPDWRTLEPGAPTEHIRDGGDDDDH